jgi:hypothetical protein
MSDTITSTVSATDFLKATVPEGPIAAGLKRQIESEVSAIVPADKHGAVLGVVTPDGWKMTAAVRVGTSRQLQLSGDVGQQWGGSVTGRVAVLYTF